MVVKGTLSVPSFSSMAAGTLAFFVCLFFRLIFARGNEKGEGGRERGGGYPPYPFCGQNSNLTRHSLDPHICFQCTEHAVYNVCLQTNFNVKRLTEAPISSR